MPPPSIPAATYRLQFNASFTSEAVTLLPDADDAPLGERAWGDTAIELPAGGPASYRNVLTGGCVCAREAGGRATLRAAGIFERFPVAFLERR